MFENVVIIGASGHGKVIADIVLKSQDNVVGFLDDGIETGTTVAGIKVLGKINNYVNYIDCKFIIAIGDPYIREQIANKLNVKWHTAIHPSASISLLDVEIGDGSVIMANAVVNSCAKIGKHCIVNTGAVIEHDNRLGDFVHISPNATLAGTVSVGEKSHIGVAACVRNNINIAANCIIGAGAAVVKDILESGTYVGVPAKRVNGECE